MSFLYVFPKQIRNDCLILTRWRILLVHFIGGRRLVWEPKRWLWLLSPWSKCTTRYTCCHWTVYRRKLYVSVYWLRLWGLHFWYIQWRQSLRVELYSMRILIQTGCGLSEFRLNYISHWWWLLVEDDVVALHPAVWVILRKQHWLVHATHIIKRTLHPLIIIIKLRYWNWLFFTFYFGASLIQIQLVLILPYVVFGIYLTWRGLTINPLVQDLGNLFELWNVFYVVTLLYDPIMLNLVLEIPKINQVLVALIGSRDTLRLN